MTERIQEGPFVPQADLCLVLESLQKLEERSTEKCLLDRLKSRLNKVQSDNPEDEQDAETPAPNDNEWTGAAPQDAVTSFATEVARDFKEAIRSAAFLCEKIYDGEMREKGHLENLDRVKQNVQMLQRERRKLIDRLDVAQTALHETEAQLEQMQEQKSQMKAQKHKFEDYRRRSAEEIFCLKSEIDILHTALDREKKTTNGPKAQAMHAHGKAATVQKRLPQQQQAPLQPSRGPPNSTQKRMDRARSQKSFASERTIPRRRASDSSSAFPPTSTQHSVAPVAASVISGHDYEPSQDDTERTGEGGGEKEQELAREEEEFEKIQEEEKEKEQDEEREEGESGQEEKMWTSGFPGGHREEQTGGNEKRDRDSIPPLRLETLQALEDTQETFQAEVDKRQAEIEMLTSRLATALQEKRVASREREEEIEDLRGQVELLQQQLHMETSRSKGFVINASSQPLSGNSRLLSSASEGKSTPRDTLSAKNEEAIPTLSEELLPSLSSQRTDNSIKGDRDSQDAPEAFPEDPTQGLKEGEEEEEDDGCVENEHEEEKLVERTVTSITGSEGDGTRAGRQVSRTDTIACSESSQKARKGETGTKALADLDETHFSPPVPADRFPSALESSATPSIPDTPTVQSVPQGVIAKILPLFGATFRQYKKQQQQNSRSEWERRGRTMSHQATSGRLSYTPTLTESTKRDSLAVPSPGLFPISPSSPFVYPTVRSEQLETTTAAGSHSVPLPPSILLDTPHRDPVVTETGGPQDAKRETGEQNEGSSLREYFKLAVLAVRLELNESGVSPPSSAASPSELWEEATEAAIPFHKWHSWLRDRLGGRKGGEKQKSPPRPLAAFLGGLRGGSSVKVGGGSSSLFLTPFKESPGTSCRAPESETDSRERAAAGHTCSLSRRSFTGSASQCPSSSFISQQPLPSPLEGDEEETKEFLFQQRQRQEELAFCHFQRGAGVLGDRDSAPASLPSLSERNLPTEAADLERDSECPTERVGCDSTHPTSVGTHEGHKEPMQPHQPPKLSTSSGWRFSLSSVTAPFAALMGHPKAVHGGDSLTWLHAAKSPQCVTETVNSAQSPGFTSADGRRVLLWDTEAGPRGVVGTPGDFSWEERSVRDSNADRFGGLRAATLRRKSGSSQSSDATHEGWRTADSRAVDSKRAENARVQSLRSKTEMASPSPFVCQVYRPESPAIRANHFIPPLGP